MLRNLIPGLLAPLVACSSVEWQQPTPELPAGWRDYRLFVSDAAYVLARDETAAEEAHDVIATARNTVTAQYTDDDYSRDTSTAELPVVPRVGAQPTHR